MTACTCDRDVLAAELLPVALALVGAVRDEGPEASAAVYGAVPEEHRDALAIVLAALVDVDQTPSELLAWVGGDDQVDGLPFSRSEDDWSAADLRRARRLYDAGVRDVRVLLGRSVQSRLRGRGRRSKLRGVAS